MPIHPVIHPGTSADNEVPTFDGITGNLLQAGTGVYIVAGQVGIGTATPGAMIHVDGGATAVSAVLEDDFVTNRYQFTTGGNNLDSFLNVTGDTTRAAHIRTISGSRSIDITSGFSRNDIVYAGASLNLKSGGVNNFVLTTGGDATLVGKLVVAGTGDTTVAGQVGIGTATPTQKLDINGITTFGGRNGYIRHDSPGYFRFQAGSSGYEFRNNANNDTLMHIENGGNVGIGKATPGTDLEVVASSASDGLFVSRIDGFSVDAARVKILGDGTVYWGAAADQGRLTWDTGIARVLGLLGSDLSLGSNAVPDELYIESGGNVGIGTTTPDTNLEVIASSSADGLIVSRSGSHRVKINGDGTLRWGASANYGNLTWDTGRAMIKGFPGLDLSFGADNGTDQLYIKSGGNVGIGTVTPDTKLDVNGTFSAGTGHTVTGTMASVTGGTANSNAGNYGHIGGGQNCSIAAGADHSVVVGGYNNDITATGHDNTIGGGDANQITSTADSNVIAGGSGNILSAAATNATISGGTLNTTGSNFAVVGGGYSNDVSAASGVIAGGYNNSVAAVYSFIGGGQNCSIILGADHSVIVGGNNNDITSTGDDNFIGGGNANLISGTALSATIPGGLENQASADYSQAGGYQSDTRALRGAVVNANGQAAVVGDRQTRSAVMRRQTTTDTFLSLTADGGADSATDTFQMPEDSLASLKWTVIGLKSDGSEAAQYTVKALVKRYNSTTTILWSEVLVDFESVPDGGTGTGTGTGTGIASWDCQVIVYSLGATVQAKGGSGETVNWCAKLESVEIVN
jgi:hypothetical protein